MNRHQSGEIPVQAIELLPLRQAAGLAPRALSPAERIRAWLRANLGLVLVVYLPTLLAAVYFGLVAADRYESQATFVVRSPSGASVSQLATLVQGTGIVTSAEDAYVVGAYMQSRDAMRQLVAGAGLREILQRPEADIAWWYPLPFADATEENLYRHYLRFVAVSYDKTTGISTLRVQGFRPADARRFADALLRDSEALINRLNERARGDAVATAEAQVADAKRRALDAQQRMTEFRNREAVIDPTRVSTSVLETITRLSLEAAQLKAQVTEMTKASPDSPQINSLRIRVAALESQIDRERAQLAGSDASLAPRIAEYERLMLEREFAERAFSAALTALETARLDAQRQRLFLERVASPHVPDYAKYPYRLLWILAVLAVSFMLYRIGRTLVVDAWQHATR